MRREGVGPVFWELFSLQEECELEKFVYVDELKPGFRNVNLYVKAIEKIAERDVVSRRDGSKHKLAEFTVGDETGVVLLTLWDERIEEVKLGKVYKISNGYTTLHQGSMRLNVGKYGSIEPVEDRDIEEVNTENDVSKRKFREFGRRDRRSRW